jgi:[ribosomal protein S18]-alanine N-acetyltransferase
LYTQSEYQIIKATLKNIPDICVLERTIFTKELQKSELESQLNNPLFYFGLLKLRESFIGYYQMVIIEGEAELYQIGVEEKFRGQGLGDLLIKHLLNELEKLHIRKVFLDVKSTNVIAIKFYEKYGFKRLGIRSSYYNMGEDALILERDFNGVVYKKK